MTKLEQLLRDVHEENLSKEQLDDYYSKMSQIRSDIKMELSGILKQKAIFMLQNKEIPVNHREVNWCGSELGLREIDLKSYISSLKDALESLKTRIYAQL